MIFSGLRSPSDRLVQYCISAPNGVCRSRRYAPSVKSHSKPTVFGKSVAEASVSYESGTAVNEGSPSQIESGIPSKKGRSDKTGSRSALSAAKTSLLTESTSTRYRTLTARFVCIPGVRRARTSRRCTVRGSNVKSCSGTTAAIPQHVLVAGSLPMNFSASTTSTVGVTSTGRSFAPRRAPTSTAGSVVTGSHLDSGCSVTTAISRRGSTVSAPTKG